MNDKLSETDKAKVQVPEPALLPESINQHYLAVDNKYYFSNRPNYLAFIDKGNKLQTKLSHAQVIGDLLSIAKQRNWQTIRLSGTKAFKQQAWLKASLQDMQVSGYRPTQDDTKQLNALKLREKAKTIAAQKPIPINQIESVSESNKSPIDKSSALQAAQEFCKALPAEDQQKFLDKVKAKLENFFNPHTKTKVETVSQSSSANATQDSIYHIKEPHHEQSLEH